MTIIQSHPVSVGHYIPEVLPEHVSGAQAPGFSSSPGQAIRLPDLYQKFPGSPSRLVRYRVKLDASYLAQSEVVAEVWSLHGVGWVELARLYADKEFYIVDGPDQVALDPNTRELTRLFTYEPDRVEYAAKVYQKVVNRLAWEASLVLEALS